MKRDTIKLYDGSIVANRAARYSKAGLNFDIISPGYDVQGNKRETWTQFVYKGVPVFEIKLRVKVLQAIAQFDKLWDKHITTQKHVREALSQCMSARQKRFKDGKSGVEPAPALTVDGRPDPLEYVT